MAKNSKKNRNLRIENSHIYDHYWSRLLAAALAEFRWNDLPATCDMLFFERSLVYDAQASIYTVAGSPDTWLSTGFVCQSGFNVYGFPTKISGVGYNQANIPVDRFVVCYDNVLKESLLPKLELYAKLLYECHNTFRSNLRQQNTPYIIKSERNTLLSIRNFFNNIFGFDPVVEVRPSFDTKGIDTLDLRVDFKGKELWECLQMIWKDAMSMLGITTQNTKKERLLDNEVQMNRMGDAIALQTRLLTRQDFCDRFNRETGMNISVSLTTESFDIEPYGGDFDGYTGSDNPSPDNSGPDDSAD